MLSFVRSAVLTNYVDVARSVNLDPYEQLRSVGISRSVLLTPDVKIPVEPVAHLLENSARMSGTMDFGLRMAETRQLSSLGPLGLLLRDEPTLRNVLESLRRYVRMHNEAIYQSLEETEGLLIIRENVIVGQIGEIRQAVELIIGAMYRVLRLYMAPGWHPHSVCFMHKAPPSLATHHRVFGNRVLFKQDFDGFVCLASDLDIANPNYDPLMARYVKQNLAPLMDSASASFSDKVRQLVCVLLPAGSCSVERVAQNLGIDRRTIHRKLLEFDQTFSAIVEEVRIELATRYVENRGRPLSEVAGLLGFSSLSAFSRWFHTHFGCSVSDWRAYKGEARPPAADVKP